MLYQWMILLLATLQFGHTSDSFAEKKLCNEKNLTLSLSQSPQLRRAIITSDPFPARAKTTCTLRVNIDAAATINLTLTTVNIWKKVTPSHGAQGYVFEYNNGKTDFVYKNNLSEESSAWTKASLEPCPYLFVWRASAPNSSDAVKSIFNESATLNATGIVIELRNIPDTAWCEIRIDINASPMPEHYCQAKDEMYCKASVQCLNASLRCDRNQDCDNGEDEMDCSTVDEQMTEQAKNGLAEGVFKAEIAVSLSVAIGVIILITAAIVVVLRRRRLKMLRSKDDSYDYSNNHQEGGASLPESGMLPCLVDNDMYSPSPNCPEPLKVNAAEPLYYVLESQLDKTCTSHV